MAGNCTSKGMVEKTGEVQPVLDGCALPVKEWVHNLSRLWQPHCVVCETASEDSSETADSTEFSSQMIDWDQEA